MKIIQNHLLLKLFILLLCTTCKSQTGILNKNTQEIVNVILKEYDSVSLITETYYNDTTFKPINVLNPYYRAYSYEVMNKDSIKKNNNIAYSVFLKDINGIISKNELDEMKEKYKSWSIKNWQKSNIKNNKVNLISLNDIEQYRESIPLIRFSEPLFTKDKKKAIIHITYSKNKTGGNAIRILVSENGKWVIKGGIANGTSG
ncbi:hypothetical protein Q4599_14350 [Cellulophaga lytica]|uniref:hypothetical protein n=1 Tax=Cellulophaga lytica TaxID=979 RepID=UPI0009505B40|nr:hypothetical protein [Cellulophaga lytica]APU09407.1 hypothetical protein A5M85_03655 [Cellulophaga lytica]MDO6854769.1 hypothetical protein [Cellulophaga lytica]